MGTTGPDFKYVSTRRDDVSQIYFKKTVDQDLGFDIQFPYERGRDYYLVISGDGRKVRVRYNEELIAKRSSVAHKRRQKILDLMNMETVHVAWDFFKENGLKALIVKSKHKLQGIDSDYDYSEWQELTKALSGGAGGPAEGRIPVYAEVFHCDPRL